MEEILSGALFTDLYAQVVAWVRIHVLVPGNPLQMLAVALVFWCSRWPAAKLEALIEEQVARRTPMAPLLQAIAELARPITWLFMLWFVRAIAVHVGWPYQVIQIVASLTSAWVVIRLASRLIRDPAWSKFIAMAAWTLAALGTLGLFDATVELLDSLGLTLGQVRISLLTVLKGVVSLAILLWGALSVSHLLEQRIKKAPNLTPSVQVLFGKLIKTTLLVIAMLVALNIVGIDLTAFAVFGGALGVGIGLGLQRIVSNLVSGLILLSDRSIKPGDVISVGDTYGWISSLGARYVAVRTRDGTEHLIPNQDLISQRVENWSHSDRVVRLRIPLGVSYNADVRLAISLCVEAANAVPRVLRSPGAVCLLRGFGDSAVDLELRFWIDDPQNGRANITSEVLLGVWDRFHEHHIEIPFPQRDVHIRGQTGDVSAPLQSPEPPAGPVPP